ncbi:MAG: HAD family hydrolase [Defluviitaleaceae bacterium]|nr:HAD family hydrolase [Defluviitaleaceae bacterium]
MKTLYVSDLDGTLLNEYAKLPPETIGIINNLVNNGMLFTYATARSFSSASVVTSGLDLRLPVAVLNGAYLVEPKTGEIKETVSFTKSERDFIVDTLIEHGHNPLVFACEDGKERVFWEASKESFGVLNFLASRQGDMRLCPVDSKKELKVGETVNILVISESEEIGVLANLFHNKGFLCYFQRDIYNQDEYWLEVFPENTGKGEAVKKLKELTRADKVICFGDGLNDIEMFEFCDESYATANAAQAIKNIATGIIGKSGDNAVAKWLLENVKME